jgi:hypothetical protein
MASPSRRQAGRHSPRGRVGRASSASGLVPPSSWLTILAFAILVVPFAIILVRLLAAPGQHIYLPDDLALIDLHTRRALQWKQQLGVFDHNGWNHPGPAYFYLLSLSYRVIGSGAKAMYVGATLINALAAAACVGVVRHRTTPARALWAALWLAVLGIVLAMVGPSSVAYSEGSLGGLVSPWNPMVVIFPLVLFILLSASAFDRSTVSLVAALVVGSFVVQANISAIPLVAAVLVVTVVGWVASTLVDRRRSRASGIYEDRGDATGARVDATADNESDRAVVDGRTRLPRQRLWTVVGLVVFVVMWIPPVIQQLTNNPGNFTLIYRFFTTGYPQYPLKTGLKAMATIYGTLVEGPAEIMNANLAARPNHAAVVTLVTIVILGASVATVLVGYRQRCRFAVGIGGLTVVGFVVMVVAVVHIEGPAYGYLVVWAVSVPVAALIGVGTLRSPTPSSTSARPPVLVRTPVRLTACAVGILASVAFCVRVVAIPPLSSVSDPQVGQLAALVAPSLKTGGSVFVNDSGAGKVGYQRLLNVEKFIGLINQLDERGYHPRVNSFWKAQFGPGFQSTGTESHSVELRTWSPASPALRGYVGRVGDLAVTVRGSAHGRSTDPADRPAH